ncbi:MAG: hypothetical protein V2A78_06035 [bacterium]
MAQIFISHSNKDDELVNFFSRSGVGTKVRIIFEEIEKICNGWITSEKIKADIFNSNAIFVVLSSNVENIQHTRDWVVAEAGAASNKDIWVFERNTDVGKITIVTPFLRHYVVFEPNDNYLSYVHQIFESYDDSHVLGTVLLTTGIGAFLGKGEGAVAGAAAGLALSDRSSIRPVGVQIRCVYCSSSYNVHLPQDIKAFRCAVCNSNLSLI